MQGIVGLPGNLVPGLAGRELTGHEQPCFAWLPPGQTGMRGVPGAGSMPGLGVGHRPGGGGGEAPANTSGAPCGPGGCARAAPVPMRHALAAPDNPTTLARPAWTESPLDARNLPFGLRCGSPVRPVISSTGIQGTIDGAWPPEEAEATALITRDRYRVNHEVSPGVPDWGLGSIFLRCGRSAR